MLLYRCPEMAADLPGIAVLRARGRIVCGLNLGCRCAGQAVEDLFSLAQLNVKLRKGPGSSISTRARTITSLARTEGTTAQPSSSLAAASRGAMELAEVAESGALAWKLRGVVAASRSVR